MYSYYVYGLNVDSEIEFPVLLPAKNRADVVFRMGKIENKPTIPDGEELAYWTTQDETCISYDGTATFLIVRGNEIVIELYDNANLVEVGHMLLGMGISIILYQRGNLVLHGSLIEMNGYAVGFLGHSGNGKSSLATSLYEKGYKLVSDDLGVIDTIADQVVVYSGFPQVKLWPDLLETIGLNPEDLPKITSRYTKRSRRLSGGFVEEPYLPLKQLYILDKGSEIEISDVKGHEALIELVTYTYDINLADLTDGLARHFLQSTHLAQHVSIRRLRRPWDLAHMPDVVKAIEDDLTRHETL